MAPKGVHYVPFQVFRGVGFGKDRMITTGCLRRESALRIFFDKKQNLLYSPLLIRRILLQPRDTEHDIADSELTARAVPGHSQYLRDDLRMEHILSMKGDGDPLVISPIRDAGSGCKSVNRERSRVPGEAGGPFPFRGMGDREPDGSISTGTQRRNRFCFKNVCAHLCFYGDMLVCELRLNCRAICSGRQRRSPRCRGSR
jgi:hypothetical protein